MSRTILKKTFVLTVFLIFITTFLVNIPQNCYGEDVSEPCPIRVEVSPFQVNIDAGGVAHYVRVLTYMSYSNTAEAFVYVNENTDAISSEYIELTRDSVGHLVIKIDLDALRLEDVQINEYNILTTVVVPKTQGDCSEYSGEGEIYIINKKGL